MNGTGTAADWRLPALREAIDRLSARRFAKDIGLVDEFEPDAIGAGSEAADLFSGAEAVRRHFVTNMGKRHTVRWVWDLIETRIEGDIGWFFAQGNAMVGLDGVETPVPFRFSGVLSWRDGDWRWRLLHGAEPA